MTRFLLQGIAPPFHKQMEIMREIFAPDPDIIKQVDLCCGRGYGKTFLSIVIAVKALCIDGNQAGLFTEPDWPSIREVFLDSWRQIVPEELYTLVKSDLRIDWINGSVLFYGPRVVTGSKSRMRTKYKGRNLNFVIADEQAIGCDDEQYNNTLLAIRRPGPVRFYYTSSTPALGAYQDLIEGKAHSVHYGTSEDNPYLPADFIETAKANMSPQQIEREIYAKFVSTEGQIWSRAKLDTAWPKGNRNDYHTKFDKSKPWWLFCDFGSATGSYVVAQKTDAVHRGRQLFRGPVWVVIADLCPYQNADAEHAFTLLDQHYGLEAGLRAPSGIVGGRDIDKSSDTDGNSIVYFAKRVWSNLTIHICDESRSSKRYQLNRLNWGIVDGNGDRRYTIARDFVSLDTRSKRGVLQMFKQDEWPTEDNNRMTDVLPKGSEIKVQHVRDAQLMGASEVMFPSSWSYTNPRRRAG